ncbi:hypothetical protein ARMGADRAFT_1026601 [Armillaria gallica]|uniref:Uncharacterized protein n=1 Tax=Armillaria gallica TaxID=47427 RepID=A0A2H3E4K3_ARMGA|nr:hypothetical protein ARMGADRAFT_1026601 [Armillaria gallica]
MVGWAEHDNSILKTTQGSRARGELDDYLEISSGRYGTLFEFEVLRDDSVWTLTAEPLLSRDTAGASSAASVIGQKRVIEDLLSEDDAASRMGGWPIWVIRRLYLDGILRSHDSGVLFRQGGSTPCSSTRRAMLGTSGYGRRSDRDKMGKAEPSLVDASASQTRHWCFNIGQRKYFDDLNVKIPQTSSQAYIIVDRIWQSPQDNLRRRMPDARLLGNLLAELPNTVVDAYNEALREIDSEGKGSTTRSLRKRLARLLRMSIFWFRSAAVWLFKGDEPLLKKFGDHQEMEGQRWLGSQLWSFTLRHVFVKPHKNPREVPILVRKDAALPMTLSVVWRGVGSQAESLDRAVTRGLEGESSPERLKAKIEAASQRWYHSGWKERGFAWKDAWMEARRVAGIRDSVNMFRSGRGSDLEIRGVQCALQSGGSHVVLTRSALMMDTASAEVPEAQQDGTKGDTQTGPLSILIDHGAIVDALSEGYVLLRVIATYRRIVGYTSWIGCILDETVVVILSVMVFKITLQWRLEVWYFILQDVSVNVIVDRQFRRLGERSLGSKKVEHAPARLIITGKAATPRINRLLQVAQLSVSGMSRVGMWIVEQRAMDGREEEDRESHQLVLMNNGDGDEVEVRWETTVLTPRVTNVPRVTRVEARGPVLHNRTVATPLLKETSNVGRVIHGIMEGSQDSESSSKRKRIKGTVISTSVKSDAYVLLHNNLKSYTGALLTEAACLKALLWPKGEGVLPGGIVNKAASVCGGWDL